MRALLALSALLVLPLVPLAEAGPTQTLQLWCDGGGIGATVMLELGYITHGGGDGCWAHGGIATYFVGKDTVYGLWGGRGQTFSVEAQYAAPLEGDAVVTGPALGSVGVTTSIPVETSMDGKAWTRITDARYSLLNNSGLNDRQNVYITFGAIGQEFRFLRIRQPQSATQGLGGYLDFSQLQLDVSVLRAAPALALTSQAGVTKACDRDMMEMVFAQHKCWFGAAGYYDAPSWFHTYYLGDSRLDRVRGTVQMVYFRPSDVGEHTYEVLPDDLLGGWLLVQASPDGATWTTLGKVHVSYDLPDQPFDLPDLGGAHVAFLRLAGEWHKGFGHAASLKRPAALLMDSRLTLDGALPA